MNALHWVLANQTHAETNANKMCLWSLRAYVCSRMFNVMFSYHFICYIVIIFWSLEKTQTQTFSAILFSCTQKTCVDDVLLHYSNESRVQTFLTTTINCFNKKVVFILNCLCQYKCEEPLKRSVLSGSWVIDQNNILHVLINNSRTAWPTEVLMPFLSSSENLLQDAYIIFQKSVKYFEIAQFWFEV